VGTRIGLEAVAKINKKIASLPLAGTEAGILVRTPTELPRLLVLYVATENWHLKKRNE